MQYLVYFWVYFSADLQYGTCQPEGSSWDHVHPASSWGCFWPPSFLGPCSSSPHNKVTLEEGPEGTGGCSHGQVALWVVSEDQDTSTAHTAENSSSWLLSQGNSTASTPSAEHMLCNRHRIFQWARRPYWGWICWLYGPAVPENFCAVEPVWATFKDKCTFLKEKGDVRCSCLCVCMPTL